MKKLQTKLLIDHVIQYKQRGSSKVDTGSSQNGYVVGTVYKRNTDFSLVFDYIAVS